MRMKIKTTLILSTAVLVACTLAVAASVFLARRRTDSTFAQNALTAKLIRGYLESDVLAQEYVSHHDDRPKTQWYAQYDALGKMIASPTLQEDPSSGYLPALRTDTEGMKSAFDALAAEADISASNTALTTKLAGDLILKSREAILVASDLADKTAEARTAVRMETDRLILVLLTLLATATALTLFLVYRRIVGAIARLQKGVEIIGKGNLEYQIGGEAGDEMGELAHAFDGMTARLKQAHDLLEQKVEERTRELKDLSVRDEIMLKSIGDGLIAIDRAWRITLWNPAAARITGWTAEEAIGKPLRERFRIIRESDRKENISFIEDAMLFAETKSMEKNTVLLARDGREVPIGDSAAPIIGEDGQVAGVIVVFRDASEERDSHILRTDFAYASHQLRTPINKALWGIELLLEDLRPGDDRDKAEATYKALKDIRKLSETLLEVTQIDQSMITARQESVDAKSLVGRVLDESRKTAEARGLKIVAAAEAIEFDVDAKLLKRCLEELVSNAVAYSHPGGEVRVVLRPHETDVLIEVHDGGIGIIEEQQPLIFTKFFRGQNVPPDATGAGLGLFIAKQYAKLLGGLLWFESTPNAGSTFYLKLPRYPGMKL